MNPKQVKGNKATRFTVNPYILKGPLDSDMCFMFFAILTTRNCLGREGDFREPRQTLIKKWISINFIHSWNLGRSIFEDLLNSNLSGLLHFISSQAAAKSWAKWPLAPSRTGRARTSRRRGSGDAPKLPRSARASARRSCRGRSAGWRSPHPCGEPCPGPGQTELKQKQKQRWESPKIIQNNNKKKKNMRQQTIDHYTQKWWWYGKISSLRVACVLKLHLLGAHGPASASSWNPDIFSTRSHASLPSSEITKSFRMTWIWPEANMWPTKLQQKAMRMIRKIHGTILRVLKNSLPSFSPWLEANNSDAIRTPSQFPRDEQLDALTRYINYINIRGCYAGGARINHSQHPRWRPHPTGQPSCRTWQPRLGAMGRWHPLCLLGQKIWTTWPLAMNKTQSHTKSI